MAEVDRYTFKHREVIECLIKKQDLHDGMWQLLFEFGIGAANAGPNLDNLFPTAIVPVLSIGLQRTKELTNLTVDASEVNPAQESKIGDGQKRA